MTGMNRVGLALVVRAGLSMTVLLALSNVRGAGEDPPKIEGVATNPQVPPATAVDPFAPPQGKETELRLWKDANGRPSKYPMRFVQLSSGHAVMRTRNGKIVPISLPRLSRADHEFIAEHIKTTLMTTKGQAIRAIEKAGGRVSLDFQVPDVRTPPAVRVPVNRADPLAGQSNDEVRVIMVHFLGRAGDEVAAHLAQLPSVEDLNLGGTSIGDTALRSLRELHQLEELALNETQITDKGLVHLRELKSLKGLFLNSNDVGDDGLIHLADLDEVNALNLGFTNVRGPGLQHVAQMRSLERLWLDGNDISDNGLAHLKRLGNLQFLSLGIRNVNAATVAHLKALKQLRWLLIAEPKISDSALQILQQSLPGVSVQQAPRILSALRSDTSVQFTGTPLKDAVAVLKDQHHVPIQLDEPGLRAAGASTDVPVALFCKGVPLHAVLRTILDKRELTYVIGDDALIITTAEEGRRLAQQGMIGAEEVSLGFPNPFPY